MLPNKCTFVGETPSEQQFALAAGYGNALTPEEVGIQTGVQPSTGEFSGYANTPSQRVAESPTETSHTCVMGQQLSEPRQRDSVHPKNLKFWTPERERECRPRPVHSRGAAFQFTQMGFESRAVSANEYSVSPFNAVGKLMFSGVDWTNCIGSVPYVGSAWLIAPRVIMTVAHNFFEAKCKDRSENIVFAAGRGGQDEEFYSVIDFKNVPIFESDPQFGGQPNPAAVNDIGVGILDRPADPKFGILPVVTDSTIQPNLIRMVGYPANRDNGLKMWMCEGQYLPQQSTSFDFAMSSDFSGGASGGPWVVDTPTGWKAIGLQSGNRPGNICYSGRLGQQARDLIAWAKSVTEVGVA